MTEMIKLAVAVFAALSCLAPASAKVQVFDYTARVDQIDGSVPAGTMITGSFSYDDALTPTNVFPGSEVNTAVYQTPLITLNAAWSGQTLSGGGYAVVADSHTPFAPGFPLDEDGFSIGSYSGPISFSLSLWNPSGQWLTNTSLPASLPSPLWQGPFVDPNDDDDLTVPHGEFSYWIPSVQQGFVGVVLSVSPASVGAVPEPATWAMMMLGFGLVGSAMRARRLGVRGMFPAHA